MKREIYRSNNLKNHLLRQNEKYFATFFFLNFLESIFQKNIIKNNNNSNK